MRFGGPESAVAMEAKKESKKAEVVSQGNTGGCEAGRNGARLKRF